MKKKKLLNRLLSALLAVIMTIGLIPMGSVTVKAETKNATLSNLGALGTVKIGSKAESGTWYQTEVAGTPVFCLDLGKACHAGDVYVSSDATYSSNSSNAKKANEAKIGYWYSVTQNESTKSWVYAQALMWACEEGETSEKKLTDVISQVRKNTGYYDSKSAAELYAEIFKISATVSCKIKMWKYGGSVDAEEIAEFEDVLKQLYSSFGLWSDDRRNIQCTGLPAASYPTFTDYLNFLTESMEVMQNEKYSHLEEQVVAKTLLLRDKIRKVIKNIVDTYGTLFDGHTSIDNILDEQIVTFDISTLKELKDEVFDAMIINIISLCWDNCVTNGKLMLNMLREGKIKLWDVTRFLILIDESHRWLNAKKTHALDLVSVYLREARKYFGGIGLASQRAADYVPEGSDSDAVNKLKNIFELTQYKFVFRQSSNAKKLLYQIFDGELTGTQIEKIPKLEIGQCILLISGDKNIEFKVHLTKDEDMLFSGGL